MAYEPTVWETGDIITAEKLNKAEQGIADANGIICTITVDDESYVADKSFSEVCDALDNAKPVRFIYDDHDDNYYELHVGKYLPATGAFPASILLISLPTITRNGVSSLQVDWTIGISGTATISVTSPQYPSVG